MTLPRILLIDDEIAAKPLDRLNFCRRYNLIESSAHGSRGQQQVAEVTFCTGQTPDGKNNYEEIIKPAVDEGCSRGAHRAWALVLLDATFGKDSRFGEYTRDRLKREYADLPIVMLTAKSQNELDDQRAVPYLSKTNSDNYWLKIKLARHGRLSDEQFRRLLGLSQNIIAASPAMKEVFVEAYEYAQTDKFVLILGESGVGKEEVANFIHRTSPRSGERIAAHNAAILKAEDQAILNLKLFGRRAGFPNRGDSEEIGIFEEADRGTLFLDEIGEISHQAQASILRVLDTKVIRREGERTDIPVDFRLITATLKRLDQMIEARSFREDLYARINELIIEIPPLRQRPEDLAKMIRLFMTNAMNSEGKIGINFADEANAVLMELDLPRNVRDIRNLINRVVVRKGNCETISSDDIVTAYKSVVVSTQTKVEPLVQGKPALEVMNKRVETKPAPAALNLGNLPTHLDSLIIDPDDPSLAGSIARLETAFKDLKKRLGSAALIKSTGLDNKPNTAAAMRYLKGLESKSERDGTDATRLFNSMFTSEEKARLGLLKKRSKRQRSNGS